MTTSWLVPSFFKGVFKIQKPLIINTYPIKWLVYPSLATVNVGHQWYPTASFCRDLLSPKESLQVGRLSSALLGSLQLMLN